MRYRDIDWDLMSEVERAEYLAILEELISSRRTRIMERARLRGCVIKAVGEVCEFPHEFVLQALTGEAAEVVA